MKSVILSSLILVSSLFLYVACVEKPASDSPDSSNSTPPIIPPVAPPATCEDIIVQAECGSTALANNVAANTCMWNGQINPQKCITRAATCAVTNNDNCGIIKPLDNTTCEINAGNCVEKAAAKPDKCEDVEPKEAAACNSAILSDATKKCKWKGGKCVEKVAEKPSTCNLLNEYDCGTKDLKKRPAETCAWNKDTKACVERKKTCKKNFAS
jgi:hypothetical protein